MVSPLESAINFFKEFGLFTVVLPFLLVFTIVFAILEKTRVLGTEKVNNGEQPKKQLNAMVAFVVAMLVVATNQVVSALNKALPNVVLLAVTIICFLMLVGTFYKSGELDFAEKHGVWAKILMAVVFIFIVLIFANSIQRTPEQSYLEYIWSYIVTNFRGPVVTSFLFLIVAVAAIVYVTNSKGDKK